jgi:hypothetical protein
MLVERPFQREFAFTQQESCLINLPLTVEYKEGNQGYQEVSAKKVQAREPAHLYNTYLNTLSSESKSGSKVSFISSGQTVNRCGKLKRVACSNNPEMKQEVFAFGPQHAERARRFYQSKGCKSLFEQVFGPPYRSLYGSKQIPFQRTHFGSLVSGEDISDLKKWSALRLNRDSHSRVRFSVASEPSETVLRVANISPKPDKKQGTKPRSLYGVLENGHSEKVDQGTLKKLTDSLYNEDKIDLSTAPIFQILCEISEMPERLCRIVL